MKKFVAVLFDTNGAVLRDLRSDDFQELRRWAAVTEPKRAADYHIYIVNQNDGFAARLVEAGTIRKL